MIQIVRWCVIVAAVTAAVGPLAAQSRSLLAERVKKLTRESPWKLVAAVPMSFRTYHPQGLVKIGDYFIVSSVEIRVPTRRLASTVDKYDRDVGEGVGHLFKIDKAGNLIEELELGEGTMYHPGGIDFDGSHVWVPVAEYRPNSRSIVYRVDPETMKATRMFAFDDHIGALARSTDDQTLHGVSWGSRRFYRWMLDKDLSVTNADARPEQLRTLNPSHYVDYQDCKYVGAHRMLCTGVTEIRRTSDVPPFRLGGLDLVDLSDARPIHQVPMLLWTPRGLAMTQNAVWLETSTSGVRAYFMPEDDTSTLYIYEVVTE